MFRSYFKIAIRNLARNRIYSFINIAGLSLGLACAMLIVLYTKDELSYDRFHDKTNNIYHVVVKRTEPDGRVWNQGSTGLFQGPRFEANVPEVKAHVRLQAATRDFKLGKEVVSRELLEVDPNFFGVFSFPLKAGDPKTALQK